MRSGRVVIRKPAAEPEVAVSEEGAHALLHPVHTDVDRHGPDHHRAYASSASVHPQDGRGEFIFRQGMLDGLPVISTAASAWSRAVAALQRASFERFPTVGDQRRGRAQIACSRFSTFWWSATFRRSQSGRRGDLHRAWRERSAGS